MRIGSHELKLEKRESLRGWQAASISILAVIVALILFSLIFIFAGKNPFIAYREIFSYSFFTFLELTPTLTASEIISCRGTRCLDGMAL